jgi:parallel beta-helix repeat protein
MGNTYYVASTGSDSNPGTIAQPFLTIAHGLSVMAGGDTLFIRAGSYAEGINNNVKSGLSWSQPTTISAYQSEAVTLQPTSASSRGLYLGTDTSYVVFQNLIFDCINTTLDGVKLTKDSGSTNGANHNKMVGCEVKNPAENGILISDASGVGHCDYNQFINCKVHDGRILTNPGHYHGFYIESNNNLVDGCQMYNMQAYGLQVFASAGNNCSNNTVRNCIVHDNAKDGSSTGGMILGTGSNNTAYNNEVYNVPRGIKTGQGDKSTTIYFNSIYNCSVYGIALSDSGAASTNPVVENNIVSNSTTKDYIDEGSVGTTSDYNCTKDGTAVGTHSLKNTDPKFTNPPTDFTLQAGSPCKLAGIAVAGITTDIVGRPTKVPPNMGANQN